MPVAFRRRTRSQAEVACAGHHVLLPLPGGGVIPCTAFVSRHDLAVAFGATNPPPLNRAGIAAVREISDRVGKTRAGGRGRGRPSYKEGYVAEARRRYDDGTLGPWLEDEVEASVNWIADRPHLNMVQRATIVRNLRKEFDEAALPRRPTAEGPAAG